MKEYETALDLLGNALKDLQYANDRIAELQAEIDRLKESPPNPQPPLIWTKDDDRWKDLKGVAFVTGAETNTFPSKEKLSQLIEDTRQAASVLKDVDMFLSGQSIYEECSNVLFEIRRAIY